MKKPPPRPNLPPRMSNNDKRRLLPLPIDAVVLQGLAAVRYVGSSKHKANPKVFGLGPYLGERGDATLCDTHAGFGPAQMLAIPALLKRGVRAELLGTSQMLWTVADSGWIFEARLTYAVQVEYHEYPVRASEPIAEAVYRRFADWVAAANGTTTESLAAANCQSLYGFK
jgi:hypothetical protein